MSNKHITWTTTVPDLSTTEAFILLIIADHANAEGVCWPNQTTIAEICRCSREAVVRNVGSLRKKGVLEIKRGKGNRVTYHLPDVIVRHNRCDGGSHLLYEGTPIEPNTREDKPSARVKLTPEEASVADTMLVHSYPYKKGRLTGDQLKICRNMMAILIHKHGLDIEGIRATTTLFQEFVDEFDVKFVWNPINFYKDVDRVCDPQTWRTLANDLEEDDMENWVRSSGIELPQPKQHQ